ncbi:MAG: hypothetical protein LUG90_09030 [Clostridiaceae bacterium]|nr:hypothetical protein [Clostridiaceae bacterium]
MIYEYEKLHYEGRALRTRSGKLLLGPAGRRLFADYLDRAPGFMGRIDFIHKMNLTEIFHIETIPAICFSGAEAVWYPSHLHMEYETDEIRFLEDKFVTEDDMAVSCQTWENKGKESLCLQLAAEPEQCEIRRGVEETAVTTPVTPHGYRVFYLLRSVGIPVNGTLSLAPGESVSFTVCAAFGNAESEKQEAVRERLICYLKEGENPSGKSYMERQTEEYGRFYEAVPEFECSDPVLNKTWEYRWYILKNSWAVPDYGNIRHGVMYEGRSHKMGKTPFRCEGWEFSRMIPLSTPLQMMDLRWRRDTKMVEDMIQSLLDSQEENEDDDLFRVLATDEIGPAYANFAAWAIYQFYLLHSEKMPDSALVNGLERYIEAHDKLHGSESDGLMIERIHQRTGKEYQPSYWYFSGYPKDYNNPETYTWLKRVDRSVYHYLNIRGLAGLYRMQGEEAEAKRLEERADRLGMEINEKMWDEDTCFYYDLHYQTDEKAMVKNIVGFYPLWASLEGEGKDGIFNSLYQKKEFGQEAGLPSVSADCPAYSPSGGWMGQYIKGRDGCVWCGPSWPYTTGIVLDMLGKQSKKRGHSLDKLFGDQLHLYALQHFRDQDISRPYLVEHYNPETGEPLSDEVDYNHSFFIQLIMEHVLGIEVSEVEIVVDPVDIGLRHFKGGPVSVRGHELTVEYEKNEYFRVSFDGIPAAEGKKMERIRIPL